MPGLYGRYAMTDLFDEPAEVEVHKDEDTCDVCGLSTAVLYMAPYKCPICGLILCPIHETLHKKKYPEHGGKK